MKLRYLLTILAAGATLFSACQKTDDQSFKEVKVSSSYVALSTDGGDNSVELTTTGNWVVSANPDWVTVTPVNGGAGTVTLKFSAEKTLDGRTGEVRIVCGDKTQIINVIQGVAKISNATCAEVIAGPDSKSYRITGICTGIANTSYGNWYINDGTGEVYIYGTVNDKGAYDWASFNIEVGDEVTVQGPKTTYNGTVELVDAQFISVNKSLIKVKEVYPETAAFPAEGGEVYVELENKGKGIYVGVPEDAYNWLSIKSVEGDMVAFIAAENDGAPRSTTVVFKTTDGKKDYTAEVKLSQASKSGTLEHPMNVAEAIAAAKSGITMSVYIKGIVSKLVSSKDKSGTYVDGFNADYGNGSFWISEDGVYNNDKSLDFEAYQVKWLGNALWTKENAQIAVGAEVILYGPLTVYNDTAETQGKGVAYVYSVNGATTDAKGIGSLDNPFTVTGVVAAYKAGKPAAKVYVSGIVSELYKGGFTADYGQGSFYLSEDGVRHKDNNLDFEAYQVNYLGNAKWKESDPNVAVGDKVVIYGPLTEYNGLVETQGKGAGYLYSLNPAN